MVRFPLLGIDLKNGRTAWTFAVVAILLGALYLIRKTLLMFIISLMFAYLLYPLVNWMEGRLHVKNRPIAVVFPFAVIVGMIVGFGFTVKPQVREDMKQFNQSRANFKQTITAWTPLGIPVGQSIIDGGSAKRKIEVMPQFKEVLSVIAREIEHFFIIPILSFLILLDGPHIRDNLIELLASSEYGIALSSRGRQAVESVLRDAHVLILQYMRSLFLLCLATLVCFLVVLSAMRVPYATLLAIFAALWEFVPLIGPVISAAAILLAVGFSSSQTAPHLQMVWVIAFLGGYRIFQDYVLSPLLMKKGVKLHPLLVMFGVFAGGEIGNVGGIFLSIPILAVVRLVYYQLCKYHFGSTNKAIAATKAA